MADVFVKFWINIQCNKYLLNLSDLQQCLFLSACLRASYGGFTQAWGLDSIVLHMSLIPGTQVDKQRE